MKAIPRTTLASLRVASVLADLAAEKVLPDTGVSPEAFWSGFARLVAELGPRNRELLGRRDALQARIDEWHRTHPQAHFPSTEHRTFLTEIGYLAPSPGSFAIAPENVDAEIATLAGPQLVVPVMNARYALNAANARWGSLYDALYGTNVIGTDEGAAPGSSYNPRRGARVVAAARDFLDQTFPLARGRHHEATAYVVAGDALEIRLRDGTRTAQADSTAFAGWNGDPTAPTSILLRHHGLHVEIHIDRSHPIGRDDPAGVKDVVLESALTTIQDFEDSVAAVDADDKALVYANWLGLMQGDLTATFDKGGKTLTRRLNADRNWQRPGGRTRAGGHARRPLHLCHRDARPPRARCGP